MKISLSLTLIILILISQTPTFTSSILDSNTKLNYVVMNNLTEYDYSYIIDNLDSDLKSFSNYINEADRKFKLSSCMLLFRNELESKNNLVEKTILKSKFDKETTFIKIYAESILNCVDSIDIVIANNILNVDHIFKSDSMSFEKYMKFDDYRFLIIGPIPYLTNKEKEILIEIEEAVKDSSFLLRQEGNGEEYLIESNESISQLHQVKFSLLKGRGKYSLIGFVFGVVVSLIVWRVGFIIKNMK